MIQIQRILLPTDFSPHAERAGEFAILLAEKFAARVHVLHVLESLPGATPEFVMGLAIPSRVQETDDAAQRGMTQLLEKFNWQQRDVVTATASGAPFVEIIRYAKEQAIDLIVMGTHGRAGLQHVLMGSVAERVVRKAPCAVMTVRPENHPFVMP